MMLPIKIIRIPVIIIINILFVFLPFLVFAEVLSPTTRYLQGKPFPEINNVLSTNDLKSRSNSDPIRLPKISSSFLGSLYNSSSCTGHGPTAICIATGYTSDYIPLLIKSTDGGNTWEEVHVTSKKAILLSSKCVGSGKTTICIVGGYWINNNNISTSYPLLIQSTDGGQTWSENTSENNIGFYESVHCTGSTPDTTFCIAAGEKLIAATNHWAPLLTQSTNGGKTWETQLIQELPNHGIINGTSCTGSGYNAICIAVGEDQNLYESLLVQSTDGGRKWTVKTFPFLPGDEFSIFNGVSCLGSGSKAMCVAVGGSNRFPNIWTPLLVQSTDSGKTWVTKSFDTLPNTSNVLNSVSCSGEDAKSVCVAVGNEINNINDAQSLIIQSNNNGATWEIKPIVLPQSYNDLTATSCTDGQSIPICTAVGSINYSGFDPSALLAQISDGSSWDVKSITDLPSAPIGSTFYGTSCTGSGSTAICIAVGSSLLNGKYKPLLAKSLDGGMSWKVQST
jgi:hypothetical protein